MIWITYILKAIALASFAVSLGLCVATQNFLMGIHAIVFLIIMFGIPYPPNED